MRSVGFISFCIDIIVDLLQIAKVCCILQNIAGCCSNRDILTFCIFGTIKGTLDVRDLVATNIDIATSDGSRTITAKRNLSTGGYILVTILSRRLIADGRDTLQVFCQLDLQLTLIRAVDTDVAFCQVLAVCTTDNIEGVVQFLGNDLCCIVLCIIAGILHAVFHGGYLVFTSLIFIYDTGDAIFAIDAFCTIDTIFVIAILDGDVDRSTILAIGAGRTCQADMTDAVFTRNGDRIFAVRAGDADFTVDTILTSFALRAGDGDTVFARRTIFAVKAADCDAIGAVQADMAILAVDANLTIFTIFARLTDIDILGQLQIIRDLAIFICGFVEQDVLASIDAFILFIIFTSFRTAFYGQSCMRSAGFISFCTDVVVDFLQITKVSCIL